MNREEWFKLPLELRQRWWDETNYSDKLPSLELLEAIHGALNKLNPKAKEVAG